MTKVKINFFSSFIGQENVILGTLVGYKGTEKVRLKNYLSRGNAARLAGSVGKEVELLIFDEEFEKNPFEERRGITYFKFKLDRERNPGLFGKGKQVGEASKKRKAEPSEIPQPTKKPKQEEINEEDDDAFDSDATTISF